MGCILIITVLTSVFLFATPTRVLRAAESTVLDDLRLLLRTFRDVSLTATLQLLNRCSSLATFLDGSLELETALTDCLQLKGNSLRGSEAKRSPTK